MYLTHIPNIDGDDYQQHKFVKSIFEGDQKVLFQRTEMETIVISTNPSKIYKSVIIDANQYNIGDSIKFYIRLNPTKRSFNNKKRIALQPSEIKPWLFNKFTRSGFITKMEYIIESVHISHKNMHKISMASILCFGFLTITDKNLFNKALLYGIGSGKGLGFGMLNIFIK